MWPSTSATVAYTPSSNRAWCCTGGGPKKLVVICHQFPAYMPIAEAMDRVEDQPQGIDRRW